MQLWLAELSPISFKITTKRDGRQRILNTTKSKKSRLYFVGGLHLAPDYLFFAEINLIWNIEKKKRRIEIISMPFKV